MNSKGAWFIMKMSTLARSLHESLLGDLGTTSALLADLGHNDKPKAVMLTCWELGFIPDQLSRANPGELIIVQNRGGITTLPGENAVDDAMESILFALEQPTVRHLIVCGHTTCHSLPDPWSIVGRWTRRDVEYPLVQAAIVEPPATTVLAHVTQQLVNLRSHIEMRHRLEERSLSLHGWIRNDATSHVTVLGC